METIKATRIFKWLTENRERTNLLVGGAGSSKSYSLAQFFIKSFYEGTDTRLLITRKTTPSLRISAYHLVLDLIKEYGWHAELNKTEMTLKYGDNEILFKGMDDPEKIKSAEFNKIWMEEATEFTLDDFRQLSLRLRRKTDDINQIYLSCNPISALHWIKTELVDKGLATVNHSTYLDNPFLNQDYINEIKALIHQDENYYKIYALGEWGILKNIIYTFSVVEKPDSWDDIIYGLDFGYNNPSALIKGYVKDDRITWRELLYQSGLTNTQLISQVNKVIPAHNRQREMFADSAEPARIEEFFNAGYNIKPCEKGAGSVKDGIDLCKTKVLGITKDSPNLIKEARTYKYKEDKDGNVLDDPVPFNDHLLTAGRYATQGYFKQGKPGIYIMGED